MSKHTPAPWNMTRHGNYSHAINAYKWDKLATVTTRMLGDDEDCKEGMANARLIASAPELLEALEVIAETPAGSMANDSEALRHMHNFMVGVARQAIAKAKGTL